MLNNSLIFIIALFLIVKGATLATKYATQLARSFNLPKYTVGFIIVAIVSVLPETFIVINSAIEGTPSFGLGMLLGSNIADLTLIFAIIIFFARRNLKIESKILKNHVIYPLMLLLPLTLGLNGYFSRLEGLILIVAGGIFYYVTLKNKTHCGILIKNKLDKSKSFLMLLFSMAVLLIGARFVVTSATALANSLKISPILISMLIVGLGTTVPELLFSLKSVRKKNDSLAIGDILGTVLVDATIVIGILALINPFSFPTKIIYITGMFMVIASFILFHFMKTGKAITQKEACLLFIFWLAFAIAEFVTNINISVQ